MRVSPNRFRSLLSVLAMPLYGAAGFWVLAAAVPKEAPLWIPEVLAGGVLGLLVLAAFRRVGPWGGGPTDGTDRAIWAPVLGGLLLYLGFGVFRGSWSFFASGLPTHPIWLWAAIGGGVLAAAGFLRVPRGPGPGVVSALVVLSALACGWALWKVTGFQPLYRIDHPSFYYRYHTFLQTFPRPGFYDPNWNAGQPVPYLVASGVWALALPWLPVLKTVSLESAYTPMLAVTFLVWVPLAGLGASRLLGFSSRAAGWTALLVLVPAQRYFTHILNYGTAPSLFCLGLTPLLLACLWRLFHAEGVRATAASAAGLCGVGGLMLCWPGSVLTALPLGAAGLTLLPRFTPRRILWAGVAAGTLVLLLHPLARVVLQLSPMGAFFEVRESKPALDILLSGRERLALLVQGGHPLIVVFGGMGLFLDPDRERRRLLAVFLAVAVVAAGWGEEFQPLLQWERMVIPALLTGAVVAGGLLDRLFTPRALKTFPGVALAGWAVALLALGVAQGVLIYGNRGASPYQVMPPATRKLVEWLRREVPEGTRILIAGRAVHGFGGAKVAALPLYTGREMISCDYYGFSPKLVEYQCPPRRVLRKGPDAVFQYFQLHTVSHVLTYHDSWKAALDRHPDRYRPVATFDAVSVYRVRSDSGILLEGEGSVRAVPDRLDVVLESAPAEVVLKYNWADGWRAPPGVELFRSPQPYGLTFIGVRPHGRDRFTLTYRLP